MKRPRKATSILTFLLLIAIAVLGADPWISFGPLKDPETRTGIGFKRYQGLSVVVPNTQNRGRSVLRNANILRRTGGGMMVSIAEPSAALANKVLQLRYLPSNEDGRRFQVTIESRNAYLDLFDWEAKPLVEFVDSGHHGAINAELGFRGESITLDDAFQERLLGLRFIQADLMLRGIIASQRYLPRNRKGVVLGNGEKQWLGSEESVQSAMRSLGPLFQDINTNYTVLTDAGEEFSLSVAGEQFVVTGTPYCLAWDPVNNEVVPDIGVTQRLKDSWPTFRRLNPLVMRAVERAFRATAFFRYQQQHSPGNWTAFVQQVSSIRIPVVPTPQRLEKNP